MNKAEIKKAIGLPHVKTAYIKGGHVYIHPIHGAKKVDLSDVTDEEIEELKAGEEAAKKAQQEAADAAAAEKEEADKKAAAEKEKADKKAAADKEKADKVAAKGN